MVSAVEDMIMVEMILADETRDFQTGAVDRHQCRQHGYFHAAVVQIAGAGQDAGAVADQVYCIHFELLAKTAQQVGKGLAMLLGLLARFGWEDRANQTETSLNRIKKICQGNRLVKDRNSTPVEHLSAGLALGHAGYENNFEFGVPGFDLAHQLHA